MPPLLRRGILFVVVFREGGDGKRGEEDERHQKRNVQILELDAYRIL
jgi:hypothetical protein